MMAGNFQDELTNTIRNGYCTIVDSYANFLEQNIPFIGIVPNPGLGAARLAQRLFCNSEPPEPPAPPFLGGQCPGVLYNVFTTWISTKADGTDFVGSEVTHNVPNAVGPVTFIGQAQGAGGPGFITRRIQANGGSTNYDLGNIDTSGVVKGVRVTSQNIVRVDGMPDTCGDPEPPPPPPPPPDYNVIDVDVTYTDNSGNDITVPITAVFAPVVIAGNGNIFAPVRVNIPTDLNLDINGTLDLTTGDINFNFGDQNRLPGIEDCPPAPPSVPDDVPDVPDDVPDYSEPDEPGTVPTVIRGCIVTVTEVGSGVTHVFQGDNPDVYLPRLGNVQFQMEFGRKIAWSEDIPVKNRRQFIRCPWEGGAIAVEGTPAPGVVWEITPVYDFSDRVIEILPFVD